MLQWCCDIYVQSVETSPANSSLNNPTHPLSKGSFITIPDLQTPDRDVRFNEYYPATGYPQNFSIMNKSRTFEESKTKKQLVKHHHIWQLFLTSMSCIILG